MMTEMIEKIVNSCNVRRAIQQVKRNKGAAGIDGMDVSCLDDYYHDNHEALISRIREGNYLPSAIKGVEIPKNEGKVRLLGIPTVIDRVLQQATAQILCNLYDKNFEEYSYGFRPNRNAHQAVRRSLEYINSGLNYIVDIDLKNFFDEVDHCMMLQILYRKIKCRKTLRLIRKWLQAPILIQGKLVKRRKGCPQGSPLSPVLSNILLDELDKKLGSMEIKYVRYADDFSIYCSSEEQACRIGREINLYLKETPAV